MTRALLALVALSVASVTWASATRTIDADAVTSSSHATTFTFPASTDTAAGISASQTLTNKTLSGASNTFSQLPVSAQYQQDLFSGNGSSTSLTLTYTLASANGLVCYLDGTALIQGSGNDYTASGTTVTMSVAPAVGQKVLCVYSRY